MNYMDYINTFAMFKTSGGFKPGLDRILALLEKLGNPHQRLKVIHVAGTNGKGSTSAMISSILHQAGYQVGLYSSPHLHHFGERFRYNGVPINDTDLEYIIEKIKPIVDEVTADPKMGRPSFFEITTALAFAYFEYKEVDVVLLEVGLGGRLDATNVVQPLVSVITSIGFDHTEYLGNTLAEIAYEKAGIIKENTPVVIGVEQQEAYEAIKKQAEIKNAPLYKPLTEAKWSNREQNLSHQRLTLTIGDEVFPNLELAMLGEHQIRNAVVAIQTINVVKKYFPDVLARVNDETILKGLSNVEWPGRLELVGENPFILLDGAHNIAGIDALTHFLDDVKGCYVALYLIMSILKDKDVEQMIKKIAPVATKIIFTQNHSDRASSAEELAKIIDGDDVEVIVKPDIASAIKETLKEAKDSDLVCITGSLYTISEARELLCRRF